MKYKYKLKCLILSTALISNNVQAHWWDDVISVVGIAALAVPGLDVVAAGVDVAEAIDAGVDIADAATSIGSDVDDVVDAAKSVKTAFEDGSSLEDKITEVGKLAKRYIKLLMI